MLKGKTIIVGVTGCIAAYKSAALVSRLKDLGADVWVALTAGATKLVGPLTFRTLSGNPVITDLFNDELANLQVPHVSLAKKADLMVIAPCTANTMGKIAYGIADNALTTIIMDGACPKLIAPAMNSEMWRNTAVQENLEKLKEQGLQFVGPVAGKLACGDDDVGRMTEPEEILEKIVELLKGKTDWQGKHVLVTAGGTREAIDPVRYIANCSSGKMGYAVAAAARSRGATVTLVAANVSLPAPLDIKPIRVESAAELLEKVLAQQAKADVVVMAAAVGDFKPKTSKSQKIKKAVSSRQLAVSRMELMETEDILKTLVEQTGKKGRKIVGFALETEDLIANAKKKLKDKDLDLIVANGPETFGSDSTSVVLIGRDGKTEKLPQQTKKQAANRILDAILRL
jgi:phosphopantothenoylcysteine decarboxylase/phosphopantothenate--cysteine ligase